MIFHKWLARGEIGAVIFYFYSETKNWDFCHVRKTTRKKNQQVEFHSKDTLRSWKHETISYFEFPSLCQNKLKCCKYQCARVETFLYVNLYVWASLCVQAFIAWHNRVDVIITFLHEYTVVLTYNFKCVLLIVVREM